MTDEVELAFRRRKFDQIFAAQTVDLERMSEVAQVNADRAQRRIEGLEVLDRFATDRDVPRLLDDFEQWCRLPGYQGFNGPSGQMFFKQIGRAASPDEIVPLLLDVLWTPADETDARRRIARLVAFVESVRKGAHPAPARSSFLCSFFWALRDHERWPIAWSSATKSFVRMGWTNPTGDYASDYSEYRSVVHALESPPQDIEHALYWFDRHLFVGLDPSIIDRVRRVVALNEARVDDDYRTPEDNERSRACASATLGELRSLGDVARDRVDAALQRPAAVQLPGPRYNTTTWRAEGWVRWAVTRMGGGPPISLRVLATTEGVHVGLHPGWFRNGFYGEARQALEGKAPAGFEFRPVWWGTSIEASAVVATDSAHEWLLEQAGCAGGLVERPNPGRGGTGCFHVAAVGGSASGGPPAHRLLLGPTPWWPRPTRPSVTSLPPSFVRRDTRPTRTSSRRHVASRWRRSLRTTSCWWAISSTSAGSGTPGSTAGPQSNLNATIRDAEAKEQREILLKIDELLWGPGEEEERINRALDSDDLGVPGLGEAVIMKLLAIVRPDRWALCHFTR